MNQQIARLLKSILPRPVVNRIRAHNRRKKFEGLSTQDTFDSIYRDGFWGKDENGNPLSGSGSHEEEIVEPYVRAMNDLFAKEGKPSVVDLGCGDFNVGMRLVDNTGAYVACDISPIIIEMNKKRFSGLNVDFRHLDLTEDELPQADFCLIRQVLQHLSNDAIGNFVRKLHDNQPYRYLVVTEHVALNAEHKLNLDKPTGPGIRVEMGSGIDLARKPFGLSYVEKAELLSIRQDNNGVPAKIVTTIYQLKA